MWHALSKSCFFDNFLWLVHICNLGTCFYLVLARLFSFISAVINSFIACVVATKQVLVIFDPYCSRVVFNPPKQA